MREQDVAYVGDEAIEFETARSRRRTRTIEIAVGRDGAVRVAAPMSTPRDEILALVARRAAWIARQRERQSGTVRPALQFVTGECLPFLGDSLRLEVAPAARRRVAVTRTGSSLHIEAPGAAGGDDHASLERAVIAWYRRECAAHLEARVGWWAAAVGRQPAAVRVRDQRSRWGSCAPDGTLRFNWRLVMADPGIFDYVIVHELSHLAVRNHSPAFWARVERVLPDYRDRKAALRRVAPTFPL